MHPIRKSLLRGVGAVLLAMAGIAFWLGGRALSDFAHMERLLAELVGIGFAVACAGVGAVCEYAAERFYGRWKTDLYAVRVSGTPRNAWVDYEEAGRTLALRATLTGKEQSAALSVYFADEVYLPPDYHNALSEERVLEIKRRVSDGLTKLKIPHSIVREV